MSRKLDKLTVLRMAVQHMKTIRGTVNSYTEGHYKLPFLSDQDLNNLITQVSTSSAFGFDRGPFRGGGGRATRPFCPRPQTGGLALMGAPKFSDDLWSCFTTKDRGFDIYIYIHIRRKER